jgi:hypothetical protein
LPSRTAILRSTIWPSMWKNAIASPFGDQVGAHEAPSVVRRRSSRPRTASRMTTSDPNALIRVAAMYFRRVRTTAQVAWPVTGEVFLVVKR